jgi:U3 small nucleolar ribonucleoprotein protein IMP4
LKRQTRQRREFLYKKALEARERQIWEKKQAVKEALAKGKPVPAELKKELDELREAMSKDAGNSGQFFLCMLALFVVLLMMMFCVHPPLDIEPLTHVDDEYDRAGIEDPKILITTSRNPSSKLLQFSKVSISIYLEDPIRRGSI